MTTADRIQATLAYMDSPRGLSAWERNRDELRMPYTANVFAAIMSATRLRRYEDIRAVFDGIGPALNARRCGKVA